MAGKGGSGKLESATGLSAQNQRPPLSLCAPTAPDPPPANHSRASPPSSHSLLLRKRTTHTTPIQPPAPATPPLTSKPAFPDQAPPEHGVMTDSYGRYIPSPPDGGWGWVIVVASLCCNMIVDGLGYSFGVFLLEFADYFQESKSKVSLVGSLLVGVYNMAGPIVGALINKFGCQPVAVTGSFVAGVAFLLSTMAPSVNILILTYGVMGGFGLGMVYLPSIVSVGYYFEKKRALATGIAVCGSGIGTFIFAPLSQYLLQELDWKNAVMVISGITLNAAICGMLMRPLKPGYTKQSSQARRHTRSDKERAASEKRTPRHSAGDSCAVTEKEIDVMLQGDTAELTVAPKLCSVQQSLTDASTNVHVPSLSDCELLPGSVEGHSTNSPERVSRHDSRISSLAPTSLPNHEILSESFTRMSMISETSPLHKHHVTCYSGNDTQGTEGIMKEPACADISKEPAYHTVEELAPRAEDHLVSADNTGSGNLNEHNSTDSSDVFPVMATMSDTSPAVHHQREINRPVVYGPLGKNGIVIHRSDSQLPIVWNPTSKHFQKMSVPSNLKYYVQVQDTAPMYEEAKGQTVAANVGSERTMRQPETVTTPVVGQSLLSLSVSKKDLARPLYRKDIFYSGSVHNLPLFRSQPDMKSYVTSITTIPGEKAIVAGGEAMIWRYLCFPQCCKDTLQEMLDFSLLKDPSFLLICFGNVLATLGFFVPFVFSVDFAVSLGISKKNAAFLISVIGITNTLGRVVTGWLAGLRKIDSLVITYVSIFICGLATAVFPLCTTYGLLCAAASLFGLSVAAFISMSSILICDMMGLEKLTNGFGLLSLFRGLAAMAGPPLAGFVNEQSSSYKVSFYLAGVLLMAGAMCHVALTSPSLRKHKADAEGGSLLSEELPGQKQSGSGVAPDVVVLG